MTTELAVAEPQAAVPQRTTADSYIPCVELRRFVQALLSPDVAGNKSEAQRISGVRRGRFYAAMYHEPAFRQWFSDECDRFLAGNEAVSSTALMRKIQRGDTVAIRTYYELRGKLRGGVVVNQSQHLHQTYVWQEAGAAVPAMVEAAGAAIPGAVIPNGNGSADGNGSGAA